MLPRKSWLYLAVIAALTHHSHLRSCDVASLRSVYISPKATWYFVCVCWEGVPPCTEIHLMTLRKKNRQTNKWDWWKEANNEPLRAISRQMPSRTQCKVDSSKLAVHLLQIEYHTYHPPILSVSYTIQASLPDSVAPAEINVFVPLVILQSSSCRDLVWLARLSPQQRFHRRKPVGNIFSPETWATSIWVTERGLGNQPLAVVSAGIFGLCGKVITWLIVLLITHLQLSRLFGCSGARGRFWCLQ